MCTCAEAKINVDNMVLIDMGLKINEHCVMCMLI